MAKKVLITGASNGIGKETARLFAKNGYTVFANYNKDYDGAFELTKEFSNIIIVQADASKSEDVERMFEKAGNIDILVNNAGISLQKLFTDTTEAEWDNIFNVNIKSMFLCSKKAIPNMLKNQWGKIINVSSIWGICGASCEVAYSASKSAVIGFTKALSTELAPSGINVNCVAPGVIDTKMNNNLSFEEKEELKHEIPAGRFGNPIDIANAIYFFATETSDYCNGQILSPNGGFVI